MAPQVSELVYEPGNQHGAHLFVSRDAALNSSTNTGEFQPEAPVLAPPTQGAMTPPTLQPDDGADDGAGAGSGADATMTERLTVLLAVTPSLFLQVTVKLLAPAVV